MAHLEFAQWSGGEANTYRVLKSMLMGGLLLSFKGKENLPRYVAPCCDSDESTWFEEGSERGQA
jgi:hypothetical protein